MQSREIIQHTGRSLFHPARERQHFPKGHITGAFSRSAPVKCQVLS